MADKKEKKPFKAGTYAVFSGIIVSIVLIALTVVAFMGYTGFNSDKVAVAYVDGIVQKGDGYNAYKQTLVSKNQKFGDFVIDAYMTPYINDEVEQNEIIGSGSEEETRLLDSVYRQMYDYYVELINTYSNDDYDAVFSNYFAKLKDVRKDVIGDDYMSTEFMFSVYEANVDKYGENLTGVEEELAQDGKTVIKEKTIGAYQKLYGENYKLSTSVVESKALEGDELDQYIAGYKIRVDSKIPSVPVSVTNEQQEKIDEANSKLDCSEDITAVQEVTLEVKVSDKTDEEDEGDVVATQSVYVVKIGASWYVDQTNVDTSALYLAR